MRKKNKKEKKEKYTTIDAVFDAFLWVPELIIIPIKKCILFLRTVSRWIRNVFETI
ncbi:MAG TPA: hypothetical protein VK085_00115 [Pseudogracilibacillus sp.]|nr:hypothetical protein [Pseudogracilibacillus sp.]